MMEVHNPVSYHHQISARNSSYRSKNSLSENEPVILHPLIIGKDIVVCMPEVNRVLRNVYQVLSQANYYLSKHGISSRRYTGAQLIRIKMLGILGHEAKVCSYILQNDAEHIFDNFDVSGDCRKSSRIQWMEPVLLDEKPIPDVPKKTVSPTNKIVVSDGTPVQVHLFELGEEIIICAPEVQKVVQANFHQGATVGYYFTKLGIVPYKFISTFHLDQIKGLGIIKRSAVHCTYITKADALRVFDAYGLGGKHLDEKIKFLDIIKLGDTPSTQRWKAVNIKAENSPLSSPKDGCLSPTTMSDHSSKNSIPASEEDDEEQKRLLDSNDMDVHVFIVENEEVVCMPDIHKIVQSIHGNSIQVNYYFNKLKVLKKRFCFAHLRELKTRNVLQNNATYCTYVPKADAEKLFQIYCLVDDPKLKQIQWSDPINLDCKPMSDYVSNKNGENLVDEEVTIHTFSLDGTILITVPDVHRIVDFLDEQSASLDYHFRKLGIAKCRFTYSQLHQLRRLNVIKRPTVCTYITRGDVDKLLSMYETERNKRKILSVNFLPPVALVPGTAVPFKSKNDKNATFNEPMNDQTESPGQTFRVPDSPCDVSPSFVQTTHSNDILSPTTSAAISHLQNIHPSIDCPIVIPNGDYDPLNFANDHDRSNNTVRNGKRCYSGGNQPSPKHTRYSADISQLMSDINRKEDELRLLHDAYRRELNDEHEKRVSAELELEEANKYHQKEIGDLKNQLKLNGKEMLQLQDDLSNEQQLRQKFEKQLNEKRIPGTNKEQ